MCFRWGKDFTEDNYMFPLSTISLSGILQGTSASQRSTPAYALDFSREFQRVLIPSHAPIMWVDREGGRPLPGYSDGLVSGGSHVGYRCGLEQTTSKGYLCPCSVWTLLKVSRYFSLYLQASQVQYWLELRWKMAGLEVMVLSRVPSVHASIGTTQQMNYMSARGAGED